MLSTCTRCRARRSKCDTLLPSCSNCAKNDLECTFRDEALQIDIPRSYIKSLNDRIQDLTSQLASHPQSHIRATTSAKEPAIPSYVTLPGRGQDRYLSLSTPSRFTRLTFEVLSQAKALPNMPIISEDETHSPDITHVDRSVLTPSVIRLLLNRYDRCIRPKYDILPPDVMAYDGDGLKKLPPTFQFNVLMACAVAAARESYKSPSWTIVSQVCRNWADELLTPIISAADGQSLAATLLLLIYELVDPVRAIVWGLLDLAIRTYLQLGWHREQRLLRSAEEAQLVTALKEIEGSLRTIFNRPTMLSGASLVSPVDTDRAIRYHTQLSHILHGIGQECCYQACPFVGEVSELIDSLEKLHSADPVVWQTWMLLLPVCVKHKQCVSCFQEVDEHNARGMKTLRDSIVSAAAQVIANVHQSAVEKDGFIPPLIASSRAFMAGCTFAVSISKRWTAAHHHMKDLIKCTEVLALYAPHWKGGHAYLTVWRTILDHLDTGLMLPK